MFPVKCKDLLPLDHIVIKSVSVRGDLGPVTVWVNNEDTRQALEDAGLVAGAVCLRYPSKFARGAMNHPDESLRREAIELTKEAAQVAIDLGCDEVVVWSAFDGYDYPFQVDYDDKWDELVSAFQECCDSFPSIKFSVEFKPTGMLTLG